MGFRSLLFVFVFTTAGLGVASMKLFTEREEAREQLRAVNLERDAALRQLQALRAAQPTPTPAADLAPAPAAGVPAIFPVSSPATDSTSSDRERIEGDLRDASAHLKTLQDDLQRLKGSSPASQADAEAKIRADTQTLQTLKAQLAGVQAGAAQDAKDGKATLQAEMAQETQSTQGISQSLTNANANLSLVNQQLAALNQNKSAPNRTALIQQLRIQQASLIVQIQGLKQGRAESQGSATAVENATRGQLQDESAQTGAYVKSLQAQISQVNRDLVYWQGVRSGVQQDSRAAIQDAQSAVTDQQGKVDRLKADLQRYQAP